MPIMNYAAANVYNASGAPRERYINGVWNKDSIDHWLTEIQLPTEG